MCKGKIPKLERHAKKNLAFVRLPQADGKRQYVYLGQFGTPNAQKQHDQTIARWLKGEMTAPAAPSPVSLPVPSMLVHGATGQP